MTTKYSCFILRKASQSHTDPGDACTGTRWHLMALIITYILMSLAKISRYLTIERPWMSF